MTAMTAVIVYRSIEVCKPDRPNLGLTLASCLLT